MSTETNRPNGLAANRRDVLRWGAAASALPFATPAIGSDVVSPGEVKRYNKLGRTGYEISDISFGASNLRPGQEGLVHLAMDRGINYFDTAESYARSQSEVALGRALKGKRDQVVITSKVVTKPNTGADELMSRLEASLKRLQMDHVDIFMNHAVNDVDVMRNPDWQEFITKAKEQGKILFAGMSGHGGYLIDCLDYALDNDLVDAVLVAHNFGQDPKFYERVTRSLDWIATQQDLPRALAKAKQKNVGVTVMKTQHGARLNDMRPYETGGATFSQAAFRWVLSDPNVDALVISMTGEDQIDEYLGGSGGLPVSSEDVALLERYAMLNGATYCRHACTECEGACPYGVPIPDIMRTRMYATDYGDPRFAREEYAKLEVNASACLGCTGQPCAGACPHEIPVDAFCAPTHRMLA